MKLVIMIPCLNEEKTLPLVLKGLPKKIEGIDKIETLLIDDGSTDKTLEVAKKFGVDHILRHAKNQGLSISFADGIKQSLALGADIIVLTEGDNQYPQERIPDLVKPILDGKADVVIGDRQTHTIEHFSPTKKILERVGTAVVNAAAGSKVPDAISGFRAYSKQAAIDLNPIAEYSWATETTIQASRKKQAIVIMPIKTNPKLRDSRQFKSSWQHIRRSAPTIIRSFIMYKPYTVFITMGTILLIIGLVPFAHFAWLSLTQKPGSVYGSHHLQSLIAGGVVLMAAFISYTLGIIADLIRINRKLQEDALELLKKIQSAQAKKS
ncbi:MAG TPA: glycosyltransferase family 2 protein [Candidatus Saccharimonadales bacterium]|nr:glycosyltransferase family 2 protein [Candidatus Saccharimonadales bacterium]